MNIDFTTQDNVTLKGKLVLAEDAKGMVLMNPGTATKTTFYAPFAEFLADNGYHVMLWNYRGFCESKLGSLANSDITYSDVGQWDIPAAITKAQSLYPDLPLYCVGHSAGGQQIGFAHNCNDLDGMVALAVSTGYFGTMPMGYRLKAHLFFKVIAPISSALFGYVKAEKLNIMEDLPHKLAKEWGQWCAYKDFFFTPKFAKKKPQLKNYQSLEFPIHVYTADDDEISTPQNTATLWQHITTKEPVRFTVIKAADMPKKLIGHMGYFRRTNQSIWQEVLNSLNQFNASNPTN